MKAQRSAQASRLLIGRLMFLAGIFECGFSGIIEVCSSEDLQISCLSDEIIYVKSAEFGRMEVGRCIKKEDEFLGCSNDVLPLLDRWCSGHRQCTVRVSNEDLEAANKNCLDILKQYLKVEHICLKVGGHCKSDQTNILSERTGYVSSLTTLKRGCGSSRSPWIISANPGQNIQLDLIDFAASLHTSNLVSCRSVYGYILEKSLGINRTICGGRQRNTELYVSKTNTVEIVLLPSQKRQDYNFVIKYAVTGCPELLRPVHAWYKRDGNKAIIGCENSNKEWQLICIGTSWQGEIGNCSETVSVIKPEVIEPAALDVSSVVIVSGIAGVAIVLSVIAIMAGVVYLNRYRIRQEVKRSNLYKTYLTIDRHVAGYYRPTTLDQSTEGALCWDMSLQGHGQDVSASSSDQCTCVTLQMRTRDDELHAVNKTSLERQSLYSSIKSN